MTALLSPRILETAATLVPGARRAAAGRAGGERLAGRGGSGVVFREHRRYAAGDDLRSVDWNSYARHRTLLVKTYEHEESLDLHVLADRSSSMGRGEGSKLVAGLRAAALVGAAALSRGDVVRLRFLPTPADAGPGSASSSAFAGKDRTRTYVEALASSESVPSASFGQDLLGAFPELRRRGAALLVTDFLGAGSWRRPVDLLLHRRVELTCIHVVSPAERDPRLDGPLRLRDAESGEELEIDIDEPALAEYRRRFERHLREVAAYLRSRGARHVLLDAGDGSETAVLRSLLRAGVLR